MKAGKYREERFADASKGNTAKEVGAEPVAQVQEDPIIEVHLVKVKDRPPLGFFIICGIGPDLKKRPDHVFVGNIFLGPVGGMEVLPVQHQIRVEMVEDALHS